MQSFLDQTQHILGLAIDPQADRSHPPRIAALHNGHRVHLFTPDHTTIQTLRNTPFPIATHDAKSATTSLAAAHLHLGQPRWACTMLIQQLLHTTHTLPTCNDVAQHLNLPTPPDATQSLDALGALAAHHRNVAIQHAQQLKATQQNRVSRIESRAIATIAAMEIIGMPFKADLWKKAHAQAQEELNQITTQLQNHPNTISLQERFRKLKKLTTAYGLNYLKHVHADGRIHPTFIQIGASTGRMACQNPNLQAVVSDGPHRESFQTSDNRTLIIADYSACELRILCEMSRDPVFREAFEANEDIHSKVASIMFNVPVSKTQHPELRHRAKAISFGLIYGMGPQGLARTLDVPIHKAETLLNDYFKRFPNIRDYLHAAAQHGTQHGYVTTLANRQLHIPQNIDKSTRNRLARNMPIQGTSADITKLALGDLFNALQPFNNAWVVNAIHDEIVVECDTHQAHDVAQKVQNIMCTAANVILPNTPIGVDIHIDNIWKK